MTGRAAEQEVGDGIARLRRGPGDASHAPLIHNPASQVGDELRRERGSGSAQSETAHASPLRTARREWRVLLGWVLAAFALRLSLALFVEHVITPDGVAYVSLGRNLIIGDLRGGMSAYWPPLYPLLAGLASLFFRDAEFAGRFVSVAAGALVVIPAHRLARAWYGGRAAALCAAVVALHPLLVYYSTVLLTEATYTLLFTCGVAAGWSALAGGRARAHALAGATFGACYLLKPEAAAFLLLLLVPALAGKLFDGSLSLKRPARNAAALSAGFLALALPYLIYLRSATGAWTLSGKFAGHLLQGSRRVGDLLVLPAHAPDAAVALAQLVKALRHEYEVFNLIFPVPFVVLAAVGLFRSGWTRERARRELYLFAFVAASLVGYAVTLPNIRFLVPLLPLVLCWVAKGVVEFEGWAAGTLGNFRGAEKILPRARRPVAPLAVAVLLASLVPLSVYLLRGDKWGDYYGQKLAARWIKERGDSRQPAVMSTVPVAAFYAGGRHVPLVDEDYAAFVERARREGVDYVVVNERNVKRMRLNTLLDGQGDHPGLRLAHSLEAAPGHRVLVYTLAPGAQQGDARQAGAP